MKPPWDWAVYGLCVDSSAASGISVRCYIEPLAYGYPRLTDERDDEEVQQLEGGLRKLAEAEGLWLTGMYCEYQVGFYGTFYELPEELKRVRAESMPARINHVLIPSPDHLSPHSLLREQLFRRLEKARVRVMEPLFRSGLVSGEHP